MREEEPEHYRRIERILLPKDYIRYRLTGEFATDASDAAGTLFLDLRRRGWSHEVLDALEVPEGWLPTVRESPDATGTVRQQVAAEVGLSAGIPVAAGGGDNAAAAIGTAITRPGLLSSSIGTSGVLFAHTQESTLDPSGRIHAFCHAVPLRYCLLAVTLSAGGSLRWWRDVTGLAYEDLVAEAERVPAGAEGLLFLPYLTGERTPHLDPAARGGFLGLTARHGRAHLTRALMEGSCSVSATGWRSCGIWESDRPRSGQPVAAPRPRSGSSCRPTSTAAPCTEWRWRKARPMAPRCSGTSRRAPSGMSRRPPRSFGHWIR